MRGLKTMLFGLALICFSGFLVVGQAVGFPVLNPLYWVMLLGLVICFVGLMMNDSEDAEENASGSNDGRGDRDGGNDENEDSGPDSEGDTFEPDHYSANRFPPM